MAYPAAYLPRNEDRQFAPTVRTPVSLQWAQPERLATGPPPVKLDNGRIVAHRIQSPPPVVPHFPSHLLRVVLLPYLTCRNKSQEHFKTTSPIAADMHQHAHIAYPTFELLFPECIPRPTIAHLRPIIEELVQTQWGPAAERPLCLFCDRMWTYHPDSRTLAVVVAVPYPDQRVYPEERYKEFVSRITAWSTDPRYFADRVQTRVLDFAMLIDFLLGVVRPWQYSKLLPRATHFWKLILPSMLPSEGRWALLAHAGPFFRPNVRWQWDEARPYLGAAYQVILGAESAERGEAGVTPGPTPLDSVMLPHTPLRKPTVAWGGFCGLARSVAIAAQTPPTMLRDRIYAFGMSWATWLHLWSQERFSDEAKVLRPAAPGARSSSAIPGTPSHISIHRLIRHSTYAARDSPIHMNTEGDYAASAIQVWEDDLLTLENYPVPSSDWDRILPALHEGRYQPTPEVDRPEIYAPPPRRDMAQVPGREPPRRALPATSARDAANSISISSESDSSSDEDVPYARTAIPTRESTPARGSGASAGPPLSSIQPTVGPLVPPRAPTTRPTTAIPPLRRPVRPPPSHNVFHAPMRPHPSYGIQPPHWLPTTIRARGVFEEYYYNIALEFWDQLPTCLRHYTPGELFHVGSLIHGLRRNISSLGLDYAVIEERPPRDEPGHELARDSTRITRGGDVMPAPSPVLPKTRPAPSLAPHTTGPALEPARDRPEPATTPRPFSQASTVIPPPRPRRPRLRPPPRNLPGTPSQ